MTRLKANTKLSNVVENALDAGSGILSDRIGRLPQRLAASRKNPFADPVREVRVRIETGKVLRILSNDLDASAEEIAAHYKRRWQHDNRLEIVFVVTRIEQPQLLAAVNRIERVVDIRARFAWELAGKTRNKDR